MDIVRFDDAGKKASIVRSILEALPDWFGMPESITEYVEQARELPLWAAMEAGQAVGFVTAKPTAPAAVEIHCMGVLQPRHRAGIGRRLFEVLLEWAKAEGFWLVQVKTVAKGHYPEYDRTIAFYEKMGFSELEVFPTLWDEWNPCLILVRAV